MKFSETWFAIKDNISSNVSSDNNLSLIQVSICYEIIFCISFKNTREKELLRIYWKLKNILMGVTFYLVSKVGM